MAEEEPNFKEAIHIKIFLDFLIYIEKKTYRICNVGWFFLNDVLKVEITPIITTV